MKKIYLFIIILFCTTIISAQSITEINPNEGMPLEPLTVTITGQNTNFTQATYTAVWFSQGSETYEAVDHYQINDDNTIEANITFDANYETSKFYDVNVYTDNNGMLVLHNGFELFGLPTPIITSVTPDNSNKLETLTVTISGENTHFNQATTTAIWFSQGSETIITPNTFDIINETNATAEFSFPISSELGDYDVNAFSGVYGIVQKINGFYLYDTIYSPQIFDIQPDSILTNDTVTIKIFGQNTHFTQGEITGIWFDSDLKDVITAETISIIDDEKIDAFFTFPNGTPYQIYNLHINSTFDGEIILENGFKVGPTASVSATDYRISVYPNPSNGFISVKSANLIENITLIDTKGKYLDNISVNSRQTTLDFRHLSKGVYYLRINTKNSSHTEKILIN